MYTGSLGRDRQSDNLQDVALGDNDKQAGAELGQAQLQLELGFTLIKV